MDNNITSTINKVYEFRKKAITIKHKYLINIVHRP